MTEILKGVSEADLNIHKVTIEYHRHRLGWKPFLEFHFDTYPNERALLAAIEKEIEKWKESYGGSQNVANLKDLAAEVAEMTMPVCSEGWMSSSLQLGFFYITVTRISTLKVFE